MYVVHTNNEGRVVLPLYISEELNNFLELFCHMGHWTQKVTNNRKLLRHVPLLSKLQRDLKKKIHL